MAKKIYRGNGSNDGRLERKVAIITGAGTGIGEVIAHKFAKEGARVVVSGLPDDPIEDVAGAIRAKGGEAIAHGADVSDETGARELVDVALKQFKRIDVLVNNAGIFLSTAMTEERAISFRNRCEKNRKANSSSRIRTMACETKRHIESSLGNSFSFRTMLRSVLERSRESVVSELVGAISNLE
jgi:NAD(P)-dependent dehydrogenase (short-subunit alcohol dehydrogenase family)